jgi:hypothetical protein
MDADKERRYHQEEASAEAGDLCLANLQAILDDWGEKNVHGLDRWVHKYSTCGAHLSVKLHDGEWRHSGNLEGIENGNVRALQLGSIIEGHDATVTMPEFDLLDDDYSPEEIVALFNEQVDDLDKEVDALIEELRALGEIDE